MPDYGDDRGFRSRGVPANIGSDRMGGVDRMGGGYDRPFDRTVTTTDLMRNTGTPANIGRDRAGGFGWNDFRQILDERGMMDSGQYLASRFGGGINDAAGMNDDAMAMIEGAGFDVAASPEMEDKRMFKKLWGKTVNNPELIGAPQPVLVQEWEKLKQDYLNRKYPGYTPGVT